MKKVSRLLMAALLAGCAGCFSSSAPDSRAWLVAPRTDLPQPAAPEGGAAFAATRLGVVTEELCVNTAKYAYSPQAKAIDVFVKIGEKSVILKLRDNGKVFNPTEYQDDSGKIITGLQMVRDVTTNIEYNRVIGFNTTLVTVER